VVVNPAVSNARVGHGKLMCFVCVGLVVASVGVRAVSAGPPLKPAMTEQVRASIGRALDYLKSTQQPDGAWTMMGHSHPAITALVVKGFIQDDRYGVDHPVVDRALAFILRFRHEDGGIYAEGEGLRNYQTSVALMALAAAGRERDQAAIRDATAFLKKLQWDEGEGYKPDSPWYGGQGYGRHKRPDLSNTQLMLEAIHQSGLPADDPTYRKALAFVSRCQMLSETNDQPFARGSTDGGFVYTSVNGGESKAGAETVDGRPRLRSYGSMTYAGFKSLLYAKVDRDDVRVKRAFEWIRSHYTLDSNPNMPGAQSKEGLFYYYHVFARAMKAWGKDVIVDARGQAHTWREDLARKLLGLQRKDGSWQNEADRWYESNPALASSYAVLALQTAMSAD